ncbi:MAG: Ig-like domain-containing protein [Marmoricola sp.]
MSRWSRSGASPRTALLSAVAAVLALLAALTFAGTPLSGATFTSTSNIAVTVNSAADWLPPVVAVTAPTSTLSGTVAIAATATDTGGSGVATVAIQSSPSGAGNWSTLCATGTSPYTCSWNTALVADGSYDLRATATDNAGFTATSDVVTARVANNLGVVLAPIADPAHGTVTLRADYVNSNASVPLSLSFQYAQAGTTNFAPVPGCAASALGATTWTCALNAGAISSGDYDFRAVGTSSTRPVQTFYDYQYAVTIDNAPPTTALTLPAGTLSGTVPLTATATDVETSVVSVAFQYRLTNTSIWTTLCTDAATPYACSVNTTSWAKGSYDFQSVATDEAGNSGTSALATRTVDNTVASVSVTSPLAGAVVRGTTTVTADANASKGVASVALQYRLSPSGAWQTICTDATAPYSCSWDSTAVTKGSVDLRALMTDSAGATLSSTPVTVTVDNSVLQAQDVQAINGGVRGKADSGDQLVLTYSGPVDPTTVLAGWSGAATPITATLNDAAVGGAPGAGDWMSFSTTKAAVNLGTVTFGQNYVKAKKSTTLNASMTAVTQTANGQQFTVVTVTLGTVAQGAPNLRQASGPGTMSWAPSTAARSTTGVSCSNTTATETGAADADL